MLLSSHPEKKNQTNTGLVIMVRNKSVLVVLLFSLVLSFGLLCSATDREDRREQDPRKKFEECQRRCQWETRGQREQDQCQERCERQFREEQEEEEDWGQHRGHRGVSTKDPRERFEECQRRCQQQEQSHQPQCQQRCERQYRKEQEDEDENRRHTEDPREKFEECQKRCLRREQSHQPQCQQRCQRQFEKEQQQQQQSQRQLQECQQRCQLQEQRPERQQQCLRECRQRYQESNPSWTGEQEEEEGRQSHNPYYFPLSKSAAARIEEQNGQFRILKKFSQKSDLLRGINQFRIAMLEANPNTFFLPHHCDAEKLYIVTNGKGVLTFVIQENKESFNLVPGVVVRVPAGSTVYLVNQDNNERLRIAVLHRPVNNPGHFEAFFPAGPRNPDQSYYKTFSRQIIETVLNARREQLDRLFEGRQSQEGLFRRASQEQLRALSQDATSPKHKSGERFAFNLLSQSPKYSNQNGRFFEALPREFKQLRDLAASIVAFEINQGSIFVPHFNTKATFAVVITEGSGYIEMVCPHLSRQSSHHEEEDEEQEEEYQIGSYKKVTAWVTPGDLFIVPAGHPVTYVATPSGHGQAFSQGNQNLKAIAFGLFNENNDEDENKDNENKRIFIAGKNNNVRQWDKEAKELAWGVPAGLVDEVFNNPQAESYFVSGSNQRLPGWEGESKGTNPLSSILDFARLF